MKFIFCFSLFFSLFLAGCRGTKSDIPLSQNYVDDESLSNDIGLEVDNDDASVAVVIENGQFVPDIISVKQGDVLLLNFSTILSSGSILFPSALSVQEKGGIYTIKTDVNKGHYGFRCSMDCGQGYEDLKGVVVVE